MDPKILTKLKRWSCSSLPLIGPWLQQYALTKIINDSSPAAAVILAEIACDINNKSTASKALDALENMNSQAGIDAVCGHWLSTRNPILSNLIVKKNWIADSPSMARVMTALKNANAQPVIEGGAAAVEPLIQAMLDSDLEIVSNARNFAAQLTNPKAIDLICRRWTETRDPVLGNIISKAKYVAAQPFKVRLLSSLKSGQLECCLQGVQFVEPLVRACDDKDKDVSENAKKALRQFVLPEMKEALCRIILERDVPHARQAALEAHYAPKDPAQKALFLLLTEQYESYEILDFDQGYLRSACQFGDRRLRSRVVEKARRAGRPEWIQAVTGSRQDRNLAEMSDEEWDTAYMVLGESGRWEEIYQLTLLAPPDWSVRLLSLLERANWKPREQDQAGFGDLLALAQKCMEYLPDNESTVDANDDISQELSKSSSPFPKNNEPPLLSALTRQQWKIQAHNDAIHCMTLFADGNRVITGGKDHLIKFWSLPEGKLLKTCDGHTAWISCIAVSPDQKYLATGSGDRSVCLWLISDGILLHRFTGHEEEVRAIAFCNNSSILATASADKTIRLWNIHDRKNLGILRGHSDVVNCLAASPNSQLMASGGYDHAICLWSLPEGRLITKLGGHSEMINILTWSNDGNHLFSGSKDRKICIWQMPEGRLLMTLSDHRDDIACLAIRSDDQYLASGSWDSTVRVWRISDGACLRTYGSTGTMDGHTAWVQHLAFNHDGTVLASGSVDQTIRLWSITDGQPLALLEGHDKRISGLSISPDGASLISSSWDGCLSLWTSELVRLRKLPLVLTRLEEIEWIRKAFSLSYLTEGEIHWLKFLSAIMRWRRRNDIQLEEKSAITIGEFDIEIEIPNIE